MKESELPAELLKFGVSEQEARLFVLLSRIRNASQEGITGSGLAELAGLDRVRTYQLLAKLVDLGIVQVEFGRPKKYTADNPRTAMRRLVSLQESRLNDLSLSEEAMAEALAQAPPIITDSGQKGKDGDSRVAVLRGISAIQGNLRRLMESRDVRAVVNDESEGHFFITVKSMGRKPKSVRVVFATLDKAREPFQRGKAVIEDYAYKIRLLRGDLPTIILSGDHVMMLYYETQRYRPKPLSAMTVRTVVASAVIIEGKRQLARMETVFEKLWDSSE